MALRNAYILTNSLRNLSLLTSTVCRSSVASSRQLSCIVRPEVQTCIDGNLGLVKSRHTKGIEYRINKPWSIQIRNYAKKKPKKGAHKQTLEEVVDIQKVDVDTIESINKYQEDLRNILEGLKQQYIHNLSLRTNLGAFDKLDVKTEDGTFPLNQIATLSQKNPSLIILNLSHSIKYVPDVVTALHNSGMNLNPQQEGPSTIYVAIPKVSREHREELAKNAKVMFNKSKDRMNHLFTEIMRKVKKGKIEDIRKKIESQLLEDKRMVQEEGESLMKAKQKELLGS